MFTGIVQATGRVIATARAADALSLTIGAGGLATERSRVGDSINVAGVCLTVERLADRQFTAAISPETLARTTLGRLAVGDSVNLETALATGDPLGGHFVTGHVDAIARIEAIMERGGSLGLAVEAPLELSRFIAPRGSVTLDGVSLTVNDVTGCRFRVMVIPHTRRVTTLGTLGPGQACNIEVDLLARYLARLADVGAAR
jgi:riboflavin synthase